MRYLIALALLVASCTPAKHAVTCNTAELDASYMATLALECPQGDLHNCEAFPRLHAAYVDAVTEQCK